MNEKEIIEKAVSETRKPVRFIEEKLNAFSAQSAESINKLLVKIEDLQRKAEDFQDYAKGNDRSLIDYGQFISRLENSIESSHSELEQLIDEVSKSGKQQFMMCCSEDEKIRNNLNDIHGKQKQLIERSITLSENVKDCESVINALSSRCADLLVELNRMTAKYTDLQIEFHDFKDQQKKAICSLNERFDSEVKNFKEICARVYDTLSDRLDKQDKNQMDLYKSLEREMKASFQALETDVYDRLKDRDKFLAESSQSERFKNIDAFMAQVRVNTKQIDQLMKGLNDGK